MTQLELNLGLNIPTTITNSTTIKEKGKTGLDKPTVVTNNTSKEEKNKTSTPKNKSNNTAHLFDQTSQRILDRRPRFEKDYQQQLVFYLAKLCQYLPWRFYVEFEVNFEGKQRFIDIVLKTDRPQHLLLELKKGTVTVEIVKEILERNYIEGYKNRTKNSKYPLLYIIGEDFTPEAEDYGKFLNQELNLEFKRCKYKPQIQVRNYQQLMQFLDSQLIQTEIGNFEFQRIKRDVPLLYETIR